MLLSLISVLVLLVIAFYALWVGATGRVSGNEGAELSVVGRATVITVAVLGFALAYTIYRYQSRISEAPVSEARQVETLPTTSSPPDSRGEAVKETETVAEPADPGTAVATAEPATAEAPAAEPAEPAAVATTAATTAEDDTGLSASAAALEAQNRTSRRGQPARIAAPEPREAPIHAVATSDVVPEKVAAVKVTPGARRAAPRRAARRAGSLLMHVENRLGQDQSYEALRLSIEGLQVAEFQIDDDRPEVAIAVPLPRPGLLHYRLEGSSGVEAGTRVYGEGCILVRDGTRFAVRRRAGSSTLYLEATREVASR